jgi:hypothetical protein
MKKGKCLRRRVWIFAVSIVFAFSSGLHGSGQISDISSGPRADVIKIDTMTAFGKLEKPPVEFLHDAHTKALAKKNKDCTACHLTDKDRISSKFKRIEDIDRKAVMKVYHEGCISCHGDMKLAREKAGPVECDGCHNEKALFSSSRQPMGFDKSLHFRHSEAQEKKCERCHHEYDEKAKKLFYAKDKEGTCRYCHKSETKDNLISMRLASHMACIDCHRKNQAKNLITGPVECSGCHDSTAQQKIEKIASVPRIEGKQPDSVLLKSALRSIPHDIVSLDRMNIVPFDHKAHETYTNTCRGCHHESLKPCIECHTLAGTKEGREINLEKAMHQVDTGRSCRGCHLTQQNDKNCVGCHGFMGAGRGNTETSCSPCHIKSVPEKWTSSDPDQEKVVAAGMLRSRSPVAGTYSQEDIPDTVVIKNLSNQYEAVDFPHRRIINALVGNIKDNKLAAYFHTQQGTMCQGCHHNSPVSKKPPRCENCHGKPFDAQYPLKPGIMGAYHLQCMGCHKEMGMEKPAGCTDCHKKKAS